MSFFGSKPAGTPSAFSTPQGQNTSAFATPAQKPGPFSLSGFGASTPAAGTTSAFGQPQQLQQTPGFGGFGGAQSTGAFGQPQQQPQQQQPQQGGGWLGASSNQAGGGFGQNQAGASAFGQTPGFGGGLGQSTAGTGGFGAFGQQRSTFGGSTGGGGFFSQQQQPQQQQPQQQGGFFGGGLQQQQQQQQQPQQGSVFGQQQQQQPFAGGWLQAPQQQPQQQPQFPPQPSITPITRWSDLPPNDQKGLEDLEKWIQSQKDLCEDLNTRSPQLEEYVSSIPTDVTEVQKRFDSMSHILIMDTTVLTNDLKPKFDKLSAQTKEAIRLLEVLSHPSASSLSYLASTHGAGGDSLIDLFLNKTLEWQSKVTSFKREIAEIDRMLKAVEEGQMGAGVPGGDEIMETLRAQWDGFCGLAARVGKLRERAAEVKIVVERGLRGGRL